MPIPFVPYPALNRHGVIGDRRTAALISADGTLDWMCLPNYDGHIVFGALLDATRGGYWRVGPRVVTNGVQSYLDVAPVLVTVWDTPEYQLRIEDAMALPGDARSAGEADARIVLRRVRCTRGEVACVSTFAPSLDFEPLEVVESARGALAGGGEYTLWSSDHITNRTCTRTLVAGESVWLVLSAGSDPEWNVARVERLSDDVRAFWEQWAARLRYDGPRRSAVIRSAVTIYLLGYAPTGSSVAAPTTSLPERIGGGWNIDYRLTWIRDASLSMASLAWLGDVESAGRYMDWLSSLGSSTESPLQVLYTIEGGLHPKQRSLEGVAGYRESTPVRIGNHASEQRQLDALGYLCDCALIFLEHGGRWRLEFWTLVSRAADFIAGHWMEPDNGIWELPTRLHYVSSRVMSWTALDRALRIAARLGLQPSQAAAWRQAAEEIKDAVLRDGWSERLGAFRQRFDADTLDAAALQIPISGLLPVADRRVTATMERIVEQLTIDGHVYRFDPSEVPGLDDPALGECEGAFIPCTYWFATALAMAGRLDEAEALIDRLETLAGPLGLFPEAIDARSGAFIGNMPLLFSHVEHVRAVRALAAAGAHPAPTSTR